MVRSSGRRLVASAAVVTVKDDPDGHGPIGARRAWPRELAGSTPACVPRSQRQTGTARPSSLAVRLSGRSRLLFRRLGADWALSASIDPGASAAQPASTLGSRRPDSNRGPLHYERESRGHARTREGTKSLEIAYSSNAVVSLVPSNSRANVRVMFARRPLSSRVALTSPSRSGRLVLWKFGPAGPHSSSASSSRQNRAVAESYYAARSRRDPAWRDAQIAGAKDRERRRREEDPERVRALARVKQARWRKRLRADPARLAAYRAQAAERERVRRRGLSDEERAAESRAAVERERRRNARARQTRPYGRVAGLTYAELRARVPDFGERTSLRTVLADEVRRGRVLLVGDVYVLNGKLPEDVKRALLDLDLVDDRH